jgi:hypothetical protein
VGAADAASGQVKGPLAKVAGCLVVRASLQALNMETPLERHRRIEEVAAWQGQENDLKRLQAEGRDQNKLAEHVGARLKSARSLTR